MTTKTENKKVGDLIKEEFSQAYCREEETIKNPTGSTVTLLDPCGYPLRKVGTQMQFLIAGEEANVDALLLEVTDLDAIATVTTTTRKYATLARGPVVIDYSSLPTLDVNAVALNVANLAEALIQMGIIVRKEPVKISTQST